MADKGAETANSKIYGLVYSRASSHRCSSTMTDKDDDLLIRSLPKEMVNKVVSRRSRGGKFRERETSIENYVGNVKGKESTGTRPNKGNSKAEYSKKQSQTGEVLLADKGKKELDTLQKEDSKNVNIPMKQKKGADGEMVREYFLSLAKSLSRLRPRKVVPAFRMVDLDESENEILVGKRVKVYWSGSRRWFTGRIVAFDKKNRLHSILYEDGDKEVLDLRKERFELEVMPTDRFRLKSEPNSAEKADGSDAAATGNVREALNKENSENVSGATTMVNSSDSKRKKEGKKESKRTCPEADRQKTEVITEELVSNEDEIPEKVSKVVSNKASYMPEFGKAISHEDDSGLFSEAVKEAAKVSEVEATVSMGSDNSSIKGRRDTREDDDLKISISELAERPKRSGERLVPRAKKMRTDKVLSREFGNLVEKQEAEMKSRVHSNETKTIQVDVDINSEAKEASRQYISRNNESLGLGPEEAKPNVLQEEIKLENGEPDKESKEGMDFISEKPEIYVGKESKSNDGGAS